MATKLVDLDLARDLPKVREQYAEVIKAQKTGHCDYRAPCVVGAMVPPSVRDDLQNIKLSSDGNTAIGFLIGKGAVVVPEGQRRDFTRLQNAFDRGSTEHFARTLLSVERKYLPVSA